MLAKFWWCSVPHETDFDELIKEVKALLTEKHEYKTLVIDPLHNGSANDLLEKAAKSRINDKDPDGTAFGGHYGVANKRIKHLLSLLLKLDMNVIITAHAKNEYGSNLTVLGQTYDCYKKLDYLFDLVFEIQKRGKERVGSREEDPYRTRSQRMMSFRSATMRLLIVMAATFLRRKR